MYYYEIHTKGGLSLYKFQTIDKLKLKYSTVKEITEKEYNELHIPILQCLKKDLSAFNWDEATTLKYYYSYYYAQTLHTEINNCKYTYTWDYCQNYKDQNPEYTKNGFLGLNHVKTNPFINHNLEGLAKDIEENGMFFPFYTYKDSVTHGVHRLYALKQFNSQKLFLFINTENCATEKYLLDYEKFKANYLQPIFNNVPFFFLAEDFKSVYKIEVNSKEMISNCATIMNDNFASLFFQHRDKIKPLNIFNKKNDWDYFINIPFPHIQYLDEFN